LPEGPATAWYDQKAFFEHKLAEPNIWTRPRSNRNRKTPHAELHLTKEQVRALTTFCLGSQESPLPQIINTAAGYRRDIQEGWWSSEI